MSDDRLRDLERRWRDSGSTEDASRLLQERLRAGQVSRERVELAAYWGSSLARTLTGGTASVAPPTDFADTDAVWKFADRCSAETSAIGSKSIAWTSLAIAHIAKNYASPQQRPRLDRVVATLDEMTLRAETLHVEGLTLHDVLAVTREAWPSVRFDRTVIEGGPSPLALPAEYAILMSALALPLQDQRNSFLSGAFVSLFRAMQNGAVSALEHRLRTLL